MRKLLALCFAVPFVTSGAVAQVGLTGGNIANGLPVTYTPAITHGGVAPTAENTTGSWYKQIGSNLWEVTFVYTITTLGSPTSYVAVPLPLSMTASNSGACSAVNATTTNTGGAAEFAGTFIFFQPATYAANSYYITCLVPVQ